MIYYYLLYLYRWREKFELPIFTLVSISCNWMLLFWSENNRKLTGRTKSSNSKIERGPIAKYTVYNI